MTSDQDFLTLKTKVKVFSKYVSIWKRMQDIFVCRVKMRMLGTRKPWWNFPVCSSGEQRRNVTHLNTWHTEGMQQVPGHWGAGDVSLPGPCCCDSSSWWSLYSHWALTGVPLSALTELCINSVYNVTAQLPPRHWLSPLSWRPGPQRKPGSAGPHTNWPGQQGARFESGAPLLFKVFECIS